MMYEALAKVYDALVKDDEATTAWVTLIETHMPKGEVLELACGSGEITLALAEQGYHMTATDISKDMLEEAKAKDSQHEVVWRVMDMSDIQDDKQYDGILCLCDSFNYLLEEEQIQAMLDGVMAHLKEGGVFIVDMHSMDRLEEFEEEYNEAGKILGQEYQWTIYAQDDRIYQNFAFYDANGRITLEQHIQRVYEPAWILAQLKQRHFDVEVVTDFTLPGIHSGEKQFYICKKQGGIR